MKKYQIKEVKEIYNHAGSKAVEDVCRFAGEVGYEPVYIKQRAEDTGFFRLVQNQFGFWWDWFKAFIKIEKGSILLVQNPFKRKHLGRFFFMKLIKKIKKCSIISIIHDVEELRLSYYRDFSTTEFEFMKSNSEYFIVHNDIMKKYFIERGFDQGKIVSLEIFDYYAENFQYSEERYNADVIIAGNLEKQKCPYVYKMFDLKNKFKLNLYGPNFEGGNDDEYVKFNGVFPSDKVPNVIDGKFGLVWDGDSLDECTGETGNYLRYNNPHKTSLYIVSRKPIVIWKEAAMARFIEENGLGITVSSLEEIKDKISDLTDEEYQRILNNIKDVAGKLEQGYYTKKALSTCEEIIKKK